MLFEILRQLFAAVLCLGLVAGFVYAMGVFVAYRLQDLFGEVHVSPRDRLIAALGWPLDVWRNR